MRRLLRAPVGAAAFRAVAASVETRRPAGWAGRAVAMRLSCQFT